MIHRRPPHPISYHYSHTPQGRPWNSSLGGPVEDFFQSVVDPFIGKGKEAAEQALDQRTSAAIQDLLKTPAGENLLLVVEDRAKKGVAQQIKGNLPWLAGLTIGGGALGGYVLQGKTGAIVGGAILGFSVWKLMQIGAPPVKPRVSRIGR